MLMTMSQAVAFAAPTTTKATTKATTPAAPKAITSLAVPKNVHALSGFGCVKLTWDPVPNAQYYIIQRSVAGKMKFAQIATTKERYLVSPVPGIYTNFAYRIIAARNEGGKLIQSAPAKIRESAVSKMRIFVTFKKTKKYDDVTVKKGTRIGADAYGGGYYIFNYKGKRHAVSRISVSNQNADYNRKSNYSKKEAAFFINEYVRQKKINTDKKYLIWVSSYTQRLYVFEKKNGVWSTVKNWDVSMGMASTPSPTGHKVIQKKVPTRHGIRFWNCFSGWNALHGVSGNMKSHLGRLASHGCIRNGVTNAGWIYANCKKGTMVIIY